MQGVKVTAGREVDGLSADATSFDGFFRSTYPGAVRLADLLIGDRWVAEDIAQEAYTRLHARFDTLANAEAYLRVAVVNAAHSYHRRRGRERARLQRVARPEAVDAAARELLDAVDRLPYRQKAVVVLRYYEDLSEAEIAAVIGCRPGTVKSLASRALARLSKEIER